MTAVIGGGAAGMMAAIFASRSGQEVTVFEKNAKIGRKLYITGKGRCNLTNACDERTVIANTPTNGKFLFRALHRFPPEETMRFFEEQGLALKTERGNRVFPVSDRAADVVDILLKTARSEKVSIVNETVTEITVHDGAVYGVKTGNRERRFDKVILACGGISYPLTGSTGDGFRFARQLGHTVMPLLPSLVPLETSERMPAETDKLLLKNVSMAVVDGENHKRVYEDFGELQLMRYGLTGATILSASAHLRPMQCGKYQVLIDLKPALSPEKTEARLLRELSAGKGACVREMLRSMLPSGMIGLFLQKAGVAPEKNCSEITKADRKQLLAMMKGLPFSIRGFRPIEEAIVTSGGVCVKEIDPGTMASKIIRGLYFAGEMIDYDCYTGGFNLQCAFSTGVLAGESLV